MKDDIHLPVRRDEIAVLRFALDHALSSTSEAHAEDRAQLKALIARLETAEKKTAKAEVKTEVEVLTGEELRKRFPVVPAWIEAVIDQAREAGRMVEYESAPTPDGPYPMAVRVAEVKAPRAKGARR